MREPGERALGASTRAVHAGIPAPAQGEPFLPGPVFAAPFHLAGDPDPSGYARYVNPTYTRFEEAVGSLEGGSAVCFASGMAAATAVLLSVDGPVVVPSDGYYLVRAVAQRLRLEVRLVPSETAALREASEGAALVWVETPSNPGLDVVDIAAVCSTGVPVAVDNTMLTPLVQQPLALGAAFSVMAATKGLAGHSDLLLGTVSSRDPERLATVRSWRDQTGAVPGPFEVWLAHRSLPTLALRLERQFATAAALAEALRARDDVQRVRYPGTGGVVGFEVESGERASRFLSACELVAEATSFGGVHSSAERRDRWGDDVPPGFIRFSCGIEDTEDVIADVLRALSVA